MAELEMKTDEQELVDTIEKLYKTIEAYDRVLDVNYEIANGFCNKCNMPLSIEFDGVGDKVSVYYCVDPLCGNVQLTI